jgi:CheY-like chemotaxis protein
MMKKRVLSVGQCAADHAGIRWVIQGNFDAEVVPAANLVEARKHLENQAFALILVNRLLDADGSSGMAVIQGLKEDERTRSLPVMLVSNLANAQRDAEQAGAVPGFGKAALNHSETLERLKSYLEP